MLCVTWQPDSVCMSVVWCGVRGGPNRETKADRDRGREREWASELAGIGVFIIYTDIENESK